MQLHTAVNTNPQTERRLSAVRSPTALSDSSLSSSQYEGSPASCGSASNGEDGSDAGSFSAPVGSIHHQDLVTSSSGHMLSHPMVPVTTTPVICHEQSRYLPPHGAPPVQQFISIHPDAVVQDPQHGVIYQPRVTKCGSESSYSEQLSPRDEAALSPSDPNSPQDPEQEDHFRQHEQKEEDDKGEEVKYASLTKVPGFPGPNNPVFTAPGYCHPVGLGAGMMTSAMSSRMPNPYVPYPGLPMSQGGHPMMGYPLANGYPGYMTPHPSMPPMTHHPGVNTSSTTTDGPINTTVTSHHGTQSSSSNSTTSSAPSLPAPNARCKEMRPSPQNVHHHTEQSVPQVPPQNQEKRPTPHQNTLVGERQRQRQQQHQQHLQQHLQQQQQHEPQIPRQVIAKSKACVYLCNSDLWSKFNSHTTEMIITKQGR